MNKKYVIVVVLLLLASITLAVMNPVITPKYSDEIFVYKDEYLNMLPNIIDRTKITEYRTYNYWYKTSNGVSYETFDGDMRYKIDVGICNANSQTFTPSKITFTLYNELGYGQGMGAIPKKIADRSINALHEQAPPNILPHVSFTYSPDNPVAGEPITFIANAYDEDGWITGYTWDFWDGSLISGQVLTQVSHTYDVGGVYNVSLEVTDNAGDTAIYHKLVSVGGLYKLSVSIVPMQSGIVNRIPYSKNGLYKEGADVILTAIPNKYYSFDHWEGDAEGSQSSIKVTMDSNKNIVAVFYSIGDRYTLRIETIPVGGGKVIATPSGGSYFAGTAVMLKAIANDGYKFSHWEGDVSGKNPTITVVINNNMVVRAVFIKETGGGDIYLFISAIILISVVIFKRYKGRINEK